VTDEPAAEPSASRRSRTGLVTELVAWRLPALSRDLEESFQRFRFEKTLPVLRLVIFFSIVIYAGFGALDRWVVPGAARSIWVIRFGIYCPMAALVLALTFTKMFRRIAQPVLAMMALIGGLGIVAMIALADQDGANLYYAGLIIVIFMVDTLLQLRFAYAAVTCLLCLGVYEWVAITLKATPVIILVNNSFFLASSHIIGMFAGYILEHGMRTDFLQRRVIETQRVEADKLLLNVLPEPIARRLKAAEGVIADYMSDVTVLFADFVGFTSLSERLAPEALLHLLNETFTAFDRLTEKHGLEKIKTIGDAYMVAGGVPRPLQGHADAVAEMALEMLEEADHLGEKLGLPFQFRIGIHSGPVIAGVIGIKKFSYDLWGDTVNTASRLESHGVAGTIQVSAALRERLGDRYAFEERGVIQLKGKAPVAAFFLTRRPASDEAVAPSTSQPSARRSPRFHTEMKVTVIVDGKSVEGVLADVSAGGLFVWVEETVRSPRVLVRLGSSQTAGMESLEVEGRVLHSRSDPRGRCGLGIAIDRAESRGQIPLRDFLLLFFGTHAEGLEGTVTGSDGAAFRYEMSGEASRLTRTR
jgi:class 3 adenylate cyclase